MNTFSKNVYLRPDVQLLFATRMIRLFGYGFLSVILVIYLVSIDFSKGQVGILLALTLVGDAVISLGISLVADSIGRRRMLQCGAVLMIVAGLVFIFTDNFFLLLIAATVGVLSPSGNEVGPFLSIEQASLAQIISDDQRTKVFAWYNLVGSWATALGTLSVGFFINFLNNRFVGFVDCYRWAIFIYAMVGAILWILFHFISPKIEIKNNVQPMDATVALEHRFGLHQSRSVVIKLSKLFALDAFGGGFIIQSIVAYWFFVRFGVSPAVLGAIFFGANILAGLSALLAAELAKRIGLVKTMVFTHLPSNILLILVPLMPNLTWAISIFLLRCAISQMDVPTRQSYVMAVVHPDERSAASGITNIVRTLGASLSQLVVGPLMATPALLGVTFYLAGGIKIVYDLLLYHNFKKIQSPTKNF